MKLIGRWWNGRYGMGRRDVWLHTDGSGWRVSIRQGDGDAPVWYRDYAADDTARAEVNARMASGTARYGDEWRDIISAY